MYSGASDDFHNSRFLSQRIPVLRRDMMECLSVSRGVHDGLQFDAQFPPLESCGYFSTGNVGIRNFCSSIPIVFHSFQGIRKSNGPVQLDASRRSHIERGFEKLLAEIESSSNNTPHENSKGAGVLGPAPNAITTPKKDISEPQVGVRAFFDFLCPELKQDDEKPSAEGATFLLLSVITGDKTLCQRCLSAGANPNNLSFLSDVRPLKSDMSHGYSPVFIAVLAEQIEILEMLCAAGGTVHVYDRWGRTPLHAAVATNSVEMVQWLMGKGAPRYVGDCLSILPAESAEEDYFPELAMPNPALSGYPKKPSIDYFVALVEETTQQQGQQQQEWEGRTSDMATTAAAKTLKKEHIELCHCHSGRPKGFCGCIDDMFLRWSMDRIDGMWNPPDLDLFSLSQKALKESLASLRQAK